MSSVLTVGFDSTVLLPPPPRKNINRYVHEYTNTQTTTYTHTPTHSHTISNMLLLQIMHLFSQNIRFVSL